MYNCPYSRWSVTELVTCLQRATNSKLDLPVTWRAKYSASDRFTVQLLLFMLSYQVIFKFKLPEQCPVLLHFWFPSSTQNFSL